MLDEICAEIRNYFSTDSDRHIGDFSIENGQITPPVDMLEGQYYRIVGSVFNDGVHKAGDESDILKDEPVFHGGIWLMRVPQDVIDLADEIEAWNTKNSDVITSPYSSESFGGYSRSLATASSADGTVGLSWKNQKNFISRLNRYRRIRII